MHNPTVHIFILHMHNLHGSHLHSFIIIIIIINIFVIIITISSSSILMYFFPCYLLK